MKAKDSFIIVNYKLFCLDCQALEISDLKTVVEIGYS